MIGALSQVTSLPVTTLVTCPTVRMHPVINAQAAATAAVLTGERSGSGWAAAKRSTNTSWATAGPTRTCGWTCWKKRWR